jgi:hypothetical protein
MSRRRKREEWGSGAETESRADGSDWGDAEAHPGPRAASCWAEGARQVGLSAEAPAGTDRKVYYEEWT